MSAPDISPAAAAEVRFVAARRLSRIVAGIGAVTFVADGPLVALYSEVVAEGVPPDMQELVDKLKGED